MDSTKQTELNIAYHTLCKYMLWRRGRTESQEFTAKEIGDALETAAGAILDYIGCDVRMNVAESSLRSCEHELKQQECITLSTKKMLDDARAEIRRLHAILAGHRIKFAKPLPAKEPVVPTFDQSIFDRVKNDPKWRYVAVNRDGHALFWSVKPFPLRTAWVGHNDGTPGRKWRYCRGQFDASNWRHSLLERKDGGVNES